MEMEIPAPKARRKRAEPTEDGEGRRRRKPKPTVEVNSTFTELRQLLHDMRPSTLQVLRTPYFRNCKAARNMRKGVRQIRDFCKQVRLETVMLSKKKQGEEMSKKRRKTDVTSPPDANASKTGQDLEPASPSHSTEIPSHSIGKRVAGCELSDSNEVPLETLFTPKSEGSPVHKDLERERSPKKDRMKSPKREREWEREKEKSPRKERGAVVSPKREIAMEWEMENSPIRVKERARVMENSPIKGKERTRVMEKSPIRGKERDRVMEILPSSHKQLKEELEHELDGTPADTEESE